MGSELINPTILLIDCSSPIGQTVHQLLTEHRYNVFYTSSVDEALHIILYMSPDLILLNGFGLEHQIEDTCRRIRVTSSNSGRNLPLIYLKPVNGEIQTTEAPIPQVDDCFPFPCMADIHENPRNHDKIVSLSTHHLLSLLRGYLRIRNLETSMEESQRQLSRAQRIMDRELGEAAKMQRSFLPNTFPEHPQLELAALYQPSIKVGGDYYDVIQVDKYHWGLVIADIAGHGSAAAVVMALTQMVVKEFGKGILSPQEALFTFNDKLNANLTSDHYVTMFYGVLDLRTMELIYSHAGHIPQLIYKAAPKEIFELKSEPSFPLRTFEMESYEEKTAVLEPGDKMLFFTDGVIDIQNMQNEFFGEEKLCDVFLNSQPSTAKALVHKVFESTEKFRGVRERLDDFTLMTLGRKITHP